MYPGVFFYRAGPIQRPVAPRTSGGPWDICQRERDDTLLYFREVTMPVLVVGEPEEAIRYSISTSPLFENHGLGAFLCHTRTASIVQACRILPYLRTGGLCLFTWSTATRRFDTKGW